MTDLKAGVALSSVQRPLAETKSGDSIGVKVSERVRSGDLVYKITD